jgi:hypothetical protein
MAVKHFSCTNVSSPCFVSSTPATMMLVHAARCFSGARPGFRPPQIQRQEPFEPRSVRCSGRRGESRASVRDGIKVSPTRAICFRNVLRSNGALLIRRTKFGKRRLIPIPSSGENQTLGARQVNKRNVRDGRLVFGQISAKKPDKIAGQHELTGPISGRRAIARWRPAHRRPTPKGHQARSTGIDLHAIRPESFVSGR